MKKTVPFKKDITFTNNISQINSIALEHEITIKKDSEIGGKFIVSGDYKITPTTTCLDSFEYELPFNISIDPKYNIDNSSVDISDFYYDVKNERILSINIELTIDDIQENENREIETLKEDITEKESTIEEKIIEEKEEKVIEEKEEKIIEEPLNNIEEDISESNINSIFTNFDENEKYVTYKIHIVQANDTLNSIITDYDIKEDKLKQYNDLSDIKIGDKIIIPTDEIK